MPETQNIRLPPPAEGPAAGVATAPAGDKPVVQAPARPVLRAVEMIVLFVGGPTVLAFVVTNVWLFYSIWAFTGVALVYLLTDRTFPRRYLLNLGAARRAAGTLLLRGVLVAALLAGALWIYRPEWLLRLPRTNPQLWLLIMVFYPLLSVYPQEIGFRALFSHRYRTLFPSHRAYVVANALAFAYAHIVLRNFVAVAMCFVGGLLLADTYERTRSTAAAWLEHTLYGCAIFTIGWGWYFYGGSVGR